MVAPGSSRGGSALSTAELRKAGLTLEDLEGPDVTCRDLGRACCTHDAKGWRMLAVYMFGVCFFLYFFLFSLLLLGNSAKVIGGCAAGSLFGDIDNPIAGVCIGILATVFLQSSSTTTSITVGLAGSGIDTKLAIYVIMGANIGTSVTNTIVAMGQMGDGEQLERAFAAATVHDAFNYLSVLVLLPIEVISNFLYYFTEWMVSGRSDPEKGDKWEGPVKKIVAPLTNRLIIPSKTVLKSVAKGEATCSDFYPVQCTSTDYTYDTCASKSAINATVGLITCSKKTGHCPSFFQGTGGTEGDDLASGWVCFILSIVFLVCCLFGLVKVLSTMLGGVSSKMIAKATNIPGIASMAVGCLITILVQSSSITTSVLTPLAGMDLIKLEQMYPMTLGANLGTTMTAIMAAMVSDQVESLQVALAHLWFNIAGILIWYPVPFMRNIPMAIARWLGKMTRRSKYFPLLYLFVAFFVIPLTFLGLSLLFDAGAKSYTALGSLLTVIVVLGLARFLYFLHWQGGKERILAYLDRKALVSDMVQSLPEDMVGLRASVARLDKHCGFDDEAPVPKFHLHSRASVTRMGEPDDLAERVTNMEREDRDLEKAQATLEEERTPTIADEPADGDDDEV